MVNHRRVRSIVQARPTVEGAGVHLHRAIGFGTPQTYDPFLLLDDFRSDRPEEYRAGFPWHPHRGMETITYVLRGEVEHRDSLGNQGVIAPGELQWMSAGSGIVHQEMPRGDADGAMYGFQLWANLPRDRKMGEPRYRGIAAGEIPAVEAAGGARILVVAGTVDGVTGPVRDVAIRPDYLDVTVPPGGRFTHPTTPGHTVFAYVFEGQGRFGPSADPGQDPTGDDASRGRRVGDRHVVHFTDGDALEVHTDADPVRFLLVSGAPLREPIAWGGPIVMNTEAELRTAYDELERGTFIKHPTAERR